MKNKKYYMFIICLVLLFNFGEVNAQSDLSQPWGQFKDQIEFEAFLDGIMTTHMRANHIAGAIVSVVKNGELFLSKGYGYADVLKKKPVSADKTMFRPGSISKLFTWTAVMQLVEQGKLDLDTDINKYLKDFKIPETYPEAINLKDLMSHSPGFEEVITGMAVKKAEDLEPLGKFLADHIPERVLPPGRFTAYSNYGTALAGYIVETVSGLPFEEYVEEHIFKPLGMNQSTFRQPVPANLTEDMSVGYKYEKGRFVSQEFELINGMAPAGSLSASADDMAKFMIAHLHLGQGINNRILQEETAREMHTRFFAHDPRIDGNAHGFWEYSINGFSTIGHGGDTLLFHSLLVLIPEEDFGFFVSYNSVGGGGGPRFQCFNAIMDRYFPAESVPALEPSKDARKKMKRLFGTYNINRIVHTSYEKIAVLMMTMNVKADKDGSLLTSMGGETRRWIEKGDLIYQEYDGQDQLLFRADKDGKITNAFIGRAPYFAFDRMKGHETPGFHLFILGLTGFFFLSVLCWPVGALRRKICGLTVEFGKGSKVARWSAGTMSGLNILFLLGFVGVMSDPYSIMFGVPTALKVVLIFPLLAAVLGITSFAFMVLAWIKGYWNRCSRVHFTLIFLAEVLFLWFLNYWKLLGYHF